MRWLTFSLVLFVHLARAETGSGDLLAHPPTVIRQTVWLYNQPEPVFQVSLDSADDSAVLQAAEAAVRAALDPDCNPLPISPEKVKELRKESLEFEFNPKDMF
mgnify:CR=1 FL=1